MNTTHAERLRQLYAEFDRVQAKALRQRGIKLTCKEGCFSCCKEPVYVERQEVDLMLAGLSEAERAEVAEAARQWLDKANAAGVLQMSESDAHKYREAKLWCPFLKDGRCRVYADRPIACRGHITDQSRRGCEDDERRRKQTFIYMPDLVEAATMQVLAVSSEAGGSMVEFDHLGIHLARALLGSKQRSGIAQDVIITVKDVPAAKMTGLPEVT